MSGKMKIDCHTQGQKRFYCRTRAQTKDRRIMEWLKTDATRTMRGLRKRMITAPSAIVNP